MPAVKERTGDISAFDSADSARMAYLNISWLGHRETFISLPEPDFPLLDRFRVLVDLSSFALGEMEVVSEADREMMSTLAAEALKTSKKVENVLNEAVAMPSRTPWRQEAIEKLEDLFCAIEDIAETAALASSKEFAELLEAEIQQCFDGDSED